MNAGLLSPLSRMPMMMAPIKVAAHGAMPPVKLVPPTTTAAIAFNSSPGRGRVSGVKLRGVNHAGKPARSDRYINEHLVAGERDAGKPGASRLPRWRKRCWRSAMRCSTPPSRERREHQQDGHRRNSKNRAIASARKSCWLSALAMGGLR